MTAPVAIDTGSRNILLSFVAVSLGAGFSLLLINDVKMAGMFVVALLMGLSLYHASFGFSAAYRRLFRHGDTRGVDAQIVLLAATMILFAPVLSQGSAFGEPVVGGDRAGWSRNDRGRSVLSSMDVSRMQKISDLMERST